MWAVRRAIISRTQSAKTHSMLSCSPSPSPSPSAESLWLPPSSARPTPLRVPSGLSLPPSSCFPPPSSSSPFCTSPFISVSSSSIGMKQRCAGIRHRTPASEIWGRRCLGVLARRPLHPSSRSSRSPLHASVATSPCTSFHDKCGGEAGGRSTSDSMSAALARILSTAASVIQELQAVRSTWCQSTGS